MEKALDKFLDIRLMLLGELIGGILIINFRGYTEVDWEAYMAQSQGFLEGDWNYMNLKGPSGPLVYPAGFLYIFSVFYYICSKGTSLKAAQYLFLALYLLNLYIVYRIYKILEKHVGKMPLLICCLSYKMHSTYLLRMFNDCVAIFFMNLCILFAIQNKWIGSVVLYSVALSIKMNILLYLPGLMLAINWTYNYCATLGAVFFIIGFQLIIAIPFLQTNPAGYFKMAFDFSRVFDKKESAYWQFVPEEIFTSKPFHNFLLLSHVLFLLIFLYRKAIHGPTLASKWKSLNLPLSLSDFTSPKSGQQMPSDSNYQLEIAYILFFTHFIGIFFSRSFHIQYYTWYIYTLPFLLCYQERTIWKLSLFILLEIAYLQYPPKLYSSIMVFVLHVVFLFMFDRMFENITPDQFKIGRERDEKKGKTGKKGKKDKKRN